MKILSRLASFLVGLTLFLCCVSISAQTTPKPIEAAVLWDEYGRIGGCDHSARLDNLAVALQNSPELEGYVVYYGPESASEPTLGYINDYLINTRGLSEDRWKTIYAGPNSDPSEPRIQLWLAPPGTQPPELARYKSTLETFTGLFSEQQRWDGIYLGEEGEGGTGPPVPDVSLPTFIDMLKQRKDTVAYLVAFNGSAAAPGAWRRVGQMELEDIERHGVEANRLKIIYGGADKETKIQLWILPESAPAPVADAGPERPPEKTIQISNFGDHELGDERGERWAFKLLLEGLRTGEELRACIIVRLESTEATEESEESSYEVQQDIPGTFESDEIPERKPADLLKLIEKWKAELADKYKIGQDRFVVLFTKAREIEGNTLETWIVPPGALLPDPDAEPVDETADDAKPTEAGKDNGEVKPQKSNPPN